MSFIRITRPDGGAEYLNPSHITNVAVLPAEAGEPAAAAMVWFSRPVVEGATQAYLPVERPDELAQLLAQLDALTVRPPAPEWIELGREWWVRLNAVREIAVLRRPESAAGDEVELYASGTEWNAPPTHATDGPSVEVVRAAMAAQAERGLVVQVPETPAA